MKGVHSDYGVPLMDYVGGLLSGHVLLDVSVYGLGLSLSLRFGAQGLGFLQVSVSRV